MPGIFSPFIYFGDTNTFFTLHTEDLNMKAINLLLEGGEKIWISIGPKYYEKLTNYLIPFFEVDFRKCSSYMKHKEIFIDPQILKMIGVPFYYTVRVQCYNETCYELYLNFQIQRKGEIVFNVDGGLHEGWNRNSNIAIASNLCTKTSIPYIIDAHAQQCLCTQYRVQTQIPTFKILAKYLPANDPWIRGVDKSPFFYYSKYQEPLLQSSSHYRKDDNLSSSTLYPKFLFHENERFYMEADNRIDTIRYRAQCKCRRTMLVSKKQLSIINLSDHSTICTQAHN